MHESEIKTYRRYIETTTGNSVVVTETSADADTGEKIVVYGTNSYEWTPKYHRSMTRFCAEFTPAPRGCSNVAHMLSGPCPQCGG